MQILYNDGISIQAMTIPGKLLYPKNLWNSADSGLRYNMSSTILINKLLNPKILYFMHIVTQIYPVTRVQAKQKLNYINQARCKNCCSPLGGDFDEIYQDSTILCYNSRKYVVNGKILY